MSYMGELSFFLGVQVQQKSHGIFLSQDKYVAEILKKFDFANVKTPITPMEPNKAMINDEEAEEVDVYLYRSMIGSLMYLTTSRTDITFAVCTCARFQLTPKTSHLHAVKRIFRYLKVHPKLGLWYPRDSPFDLEPFFDSDYAGASLDRKSTTAEYVAAANCCGHVLWIQNQMLDYGFNFMNTKIYIDNESTICIVKNLVFHSKTKHIEIRHHFIRDSYKKKLIQVIKIHTEQNVTDLLTKAFDLELLGKPGRDTKIPQSGGPSTKVGDEAVHKELGDRMERATTTASSFEAEQDSSGPRCQDTILGDADAQTWFEAASKQSNDPPLSRVNTLESGEDNIKLMELMKSEGSEGFHQIIYFLFTSHIKYALTESPIIYVLLIHQFWDTTSPSTSENEEMEITATIDERVKTVTEASIRRHLKLEDYDGIPTLSNTEIFEQLALIGYVSNSDSLTFQKVHFSPQWKFLIHTILHYLSGKKTAWEQFSSNIATAIICLATNKTFNFSKMIFDGMKKNLDSNTKFLMYPRFIQIFLIKHKRQLLPHKRTYTAPTPAHKLFSNMRRAFKGYTRVDTLLFQTMLAQGETLQGKGSTIPSTSQPPTTPPSMQTTHEAEEPTTMPHELSQGFNHLEKVESLESDLKQTKLTYSTAFTKLIRRVKKLENTMKSSKARRKVRLVVSEDERVSTVGEIPEGVSTAEPDIYITLAEALVDLLKSGKKEPPKPKARGISFQDLEEVARKEVISPPTNEELALRLHDEEQAEFERVQKERVAQEEASKATINEELDDIQAMIEADE
ncbi:putative ribonuclease H-like domain-containing protein [Tanacetum coccineum]